MNKDVKEYDKSLLGLAKHMLNDSIKNNVLKIVEDISDNTLNEIINILSKEKSYQDKILKYRLSIHDDPKILGNTEDKSKLDEMYKYIKNNTFQMKQVENFDKEKWNIKLLEANLEKDSYLELNEAIKKVKKELENNKSIDNFNEVQKINDEKQLFLDWYDKRIAELEEELRNLDNPPIVHCSKNIGNISSLGVEVLELMDDLQADIEEGNNITGDLNCLIDSLTKWRIELNEKVLYNIRVD